jgi:hypothetical protein
MKSLIETLEDSGLLVQEDSSKVVELISEARAYLPKRNISARDALAQRVQDLKYISKLDRRQRSLLDH